MGSKFYLKGNKLSNSEKKFDQRPQLDWRFTRVQMKLDVYGPTAVLGNSLF